MGKADRRKADTGRAGSPDAPCQALPGGPADRTAGNAARLMQAVEITPFTDHANPELKPRVTAPDDAPEAVSDIYPPLDPVAAWRQSLQFVDPNHHGTGQTYPGFVIGDPPA